MKENFFTKIMLVHCAVKMKAEVFVCFKTPVEHKVICEQSTNRGNSSDLGSIR